MNLTNFDISSTGVNISEYRTFFSHKLKSEIIEKNFIPYIVSGVQFFTNNGQTKMPSVSDPNSWDKTLSHIDEDIELTVNEKMNSLDTEEAILTLYVHHFELTDIFFLNLKGDIVKGNPFLGGLVPLIAITRDDYFKIKDPQEYFTNIFSNMPFDFKLTFEDTFNHKGIPIEIEFSDVFDEKERYSIFKDGAYVSTKTNTYFKEKLCDYIAELHSEHNLSKEAKDELIRFITHKTPETPSLSLS